MQYIGLSAKTYLFYQSFIDIFNLYRPFPAVFYVNASIAAKILVNHKAYIICRWPISDQIYLPHILLSIPYVRLAEEHTGVA